MFLPTKCKTPLFSTASVVLLTLFVIVTQLILTGWGGVWQCGLHCIFLRITDIRELSVGSNCVLCLVNCLSKPITYSPWTCFAPEFLGFLLSFHPWALIRHRVCKSCLCRMSQSSVASSAVQKLCSLIKPHLLIFTFEFCALRILEKKKKILAAPVSRPVSPYGTSFWDSALEAKLLSCWCQFLRLIFLDFLATPLFRGNRTHLVF